MDAPPIFIVLNLRHDNTVGQDIDLQVQQD